MFRLPLLRRQLSSFSRASFLGRVDVSEVYPYPQVLSSEQREELGSLVPVIEKWFELENDPAANDASANIPDATWKSVKELGLMGLQVPTELDGLGLSNSAYARLGEIMGSDLGLSIAIGAHQSIGFKGILLFGNEEQKKKYLPKLASGEYVAAFALTEPGTGSDAKSVTTKAVKDGDDWVINGSKIWISNGGIADVFTVFAATPETADPSNPAKNHMTAFIVERSMAGVTSGAPEKKMGIKCSNTAEVYLENVRVPAANVIDVPGNGFKVAMEILNNGRFGMGGALSGTMKQLLAKGAVQAAERTQFGDKIANFGVIQEKLGRTAARLYATESVAYTISSNMDRGSTDYQIEAAIGKVFASESAWEMADEVLQIYGGMGFMADAGIERVVRDLRIFRIFEGTNEILRLFIALTGIQAASKEVKNLSLMDKVGFVARRNKIPFVSSAPDFPGTLPSQLTGAGAAIAANTQLFGDAILSSMQRHRKDIINQQMTLTRLADAAMYNYASACAVSRAAAAVSDGLDTAENEVKLARSFTTTATKVIQDRLAQVFDADATEAHDAEVAAVAKDVLAAGGHTTTHPLRV
jgi:very long chain acyl-CoA dehydrogenase